MSTPADDTTGRVPAGRRRARRRWWAAGAAVLAVVVAFVAVTGVTGIGGPTWLRRYPYAELRSLADAVNAEAGDLRTPDDCWRTTPSTDGTHRDPDGPRREIAKVDYVRSRVVVRGYANQSGIIDRTTQRALNERLDAVMASDAGFSRSMIDVEPSPDGWSPLVSCRLVTRGWIAGF